VALALAAADGSSVPLWAALLIGLGGGLVGTIARIGYERTAELRTRMIVASDEFSTAVADALGVILEATRVYDDEKPGNLVSLSRTLDEKVNVVNQRLSRVHLLIGVPEDSPAGAWAGVCASGLRNAASLLRGRSRPDPDDRWSLQQFIGAECDVQEAQLEFSRHARREIRAGTLFAVRVRTERAGGMLRRLVNRGR
jgi:hypothetical protein